MALPVSKIGIHSFMSLRGQLEPPRAALEVDQRPGVDGSEILYTGKRGSPFTLVSLVDCASYADAQDVFNQYKAVQLDLIAGGLPVVQSDYSTNAHGYVCKTLAIRLLGIRQAPVIVGGLIYTSGAILEVEWTLLSIAQ